jgi:hypothetical protein
VAVRQAQNRIMPIWQPSVARELSPARKTVLISETQIITDMDLRAKIAPDVLEFRQNGTGSAY